MTYKPNALGMTNLPKTQPGIEFQIFFTSVIQERFDDACAVYPLFNLKSTEIANYATVHHRDLPMETALKVIDTLLFTKNFDPNPSFPIILPDFSGQVFIPNFEHEEEDVVRPENFSNK